jgi:hypothetical protein
VGEVRIVSDMHERKAEMARQSEAFIALPGARSFFSATMNHTGNSVELNCPFLFRRVWNNGGAAGDDNVVATRNPQQTSK